ncbi:hypothetical protein H6F74_26485 [Trichocoleus sp. FACHB-90]|uniref:hypothetical protein n=1 Tax=Cyanophyceae TaxID=3028117 RepID=UPI001688B1CB|nr:hypothetical protein [Trichocoleus sp. FACHB-90]MBD1929753.1 hypothetical protein [Trichocoleus sp. FACHB-90]
MAFLSWVEYIAVLTFGLLWQRHGNAISLQMYSTQPLNCYISGCSGEAYVRPFKQWVTITT